MLEYLKIIFRCRFLLFILLLHLRSLTLKEEANVRLKRQVEDLKHVQHHSEIMSKRLKQVTKEKEDLLIRYIYTMSFVLTGTFYQRLIS